MPRTTTRDTARLHAPRRTDGIVAHVKDLILRGAVGPGERLPSERELARAWRVGRPSVREALQQLEAMGFVEVRAARGSFVRSLTPQGIEEPLRRAAAEERTIVAQVLDVRMALEGWIAAEAARAATDEQIARVSSIVLQLTQAAERGEPLSSLDAEFHRAIVEATGNTVMRHMLDSLTSLGATVRSFKRRIGFRQTQPLAFTEHHREVARALAARDGDAARAAMVAHLQMAKDMVLAEARARDAERAREARAAKRGPDARRAGEPRRRANAAAATAGGRRRRATRGRTPSRAAGR
jgi:GntR family transcriptional repressor for pyruvate dehydrogenase complex